MKLSRIHIQQTHLAFSNRSKEDIEREVEARNSSTITQISVTGCRLEDGLPKMPDNVEFFVVRKCSFLEGQNIEVFGANLKIVELQHCKLTQFPVFYSQSINKINVSHNLISEILQLKNKSLRLLDIRNNLIVRITRDIYANNLTVLHEFLFKKGEKNGISLPLCLRPCVLEIEKIVSQSLKGWSNTELIETCQQIIDNNNCTLLGQILPYLTEQFVVKIFKIAKMKRKHSIVSLLISQYNCEPPEDDEALELLMSEYISKLQLVKVGLAAILKTISTYSNDKERVAAFLLHLTQVQGSKNFFIQSQKDLIHYMSLNLTFPHPYQADFLLTQLTFFNDYDFNNQAILKYLLHLDSLKLINALLMLPAFNDQMFALGLYKKLLKPNKKLFKILQKQDKLYQKTYTYKNDPYFPEYRQRRSFCLKNDLYDYDILSEYQQMQCSYTRKDLKYTFKFCNKQNEVSVAKRIETHLKKKCLKTLQIRRSNYSSIQSTSHA